jgi:hypothetical protein
MALGNDAQPEAKDAVQRLGWPLPAVKGKGWYGCGVVTVRLGKAGDGSREAVRAC